MREILLLWKRVLKRIDVTSRSLAALIEPGSCFAGTLAELAFASDRSYMALGRFDGDNRPEATLTLSPLNFGRYPMGNGLSRLETRFLGTPEAVDTARARTGEPLDAAAAETLGLVTFAFDDIDWEDEIRVAGAQGARALASGLSRLVGPDGAGRLPPQRTAQQRIAQRCSVLRCLDSSSRRTAARGFWVLGGCFCCGCEKGFVICLWLAWRRPTLPGLEAQYHRR
jgi:hypothetical protein